jgi:heptosyltransferase-2
MNYPHQVEKYNEFVNLSLGADFDAGDLYIYSKLNSTSVNSIPFIGINPGASYGSSKRWYPEEFAKVALKLSSKYNILIFGGPEEKIIAQDIENLLIEYGVSNYLNLAGKTSIEQLTERISELKLFITGDSGPMHLAAAKKIPTISIFGPTNHTETSQWKNQSSIIIKKDLDCQPCMKRKCPYGHHNCMKNVKAEEVIRAALEII